MKKSILGAAIGAALILGQGCASTTPTHSTSYTDNTLSRSFQTPQPSTAQMRRKTELVEELCTLNTELARVTVQQRDLGVPIHEVLDIHDSQDQGEDGPFHRFGNLQMQETIMDIYEDPYMSGSQAAVHAYTKCKREWTKVYLSGS